MLEIDAKGAAGEVWACVDGVGLFRSDDHGATWAQKKKTYDIQTFAISPHDRKRILIAGANTPKRMEPQISIDGGASWTNVATLPFPGQPEPFHSYIHATHAYYIFHATDPNKVFAARYQHFGRSTDGGQTFVWASNDFDYNCVYDIAVDPADWTQMALDHAGPDAGLHRERPRLDLGRRGRRRRSRRRSCARRATPAQPTPAAGR